MLGSKQGSKQGSRVSGFTLVGIAAPAPGAAPPVRVLYMKYGAKGKMNIFIWGRARGSARHWPEVKPRGATLLVNALGDPRKRAERPPQAFLTLACFK